VRCRSLFLLLPRLNPNPKGEILDVLIPYCSVTYEYSRFVSFSLCAGFFSLQSEDFGVCVTNGFSHTGISQN